MPKIPTDPAQQAENKLEQAATELLKNSNTVVPTPVIFCGVNRKINTGNFENLDVYFGLSVPVMAFPTDDLEEFKKALSEAAELGFYVASKETGERYTRIKDLQSGDK